MSGDPNADIGPLLRNPGCGKSAFGDMSGDKVAARCDLVESDEYFVLGQPGAFPRQNQARFRQDPEFAGLMRVGGLVRAIPYPVAAGPFLVAIPIAIGSQRGVNQDAGLAR